MIVDSVEGARAILAPRSLAIFGASDDIGKFGGRLVRFIAQHGFSGETFYITRDGRPVNGRPSYLSVTDIGTAVDVAVMAIPAPGVPAAVQECAKAGVTAAVIISSGFSEVGAEGVALQERIREVSESTGIRLLGPNCLGAVNPHQRLALTSSVSLAEGELILGDVALVSQSGALMVSLIDWARARGRGFSGTVSLGNQVDLELADFLDFFAEDPHTRAVCAYVEGVRRPGRLMESLGRCRDAGKPVVLLKVGRTPSGIDSVAAHTASFAGSFQVFRAAAESAGARFADDPVGMIELAQGLAAVGTRVRSIGVISTSGGANGIIGDAAAEAGVRLAELAPRTLSGLTAHLAPLQVRNPVDLGARLGTRTAPEDGEGLARLLAADPAVDLLLVVLTSSPGLAEVTTGIVRGAAGSGTPVAGLSMLGRVGDASRKVLADAGGVCFERLHDALAVLRELGAEPVHEEPVVPLEMDLASLADAEVLTEDAAKALLDVAGVATNAGVLVSDEAAAAAAAEGLGFPVVLKICSPSVVHKSDAGGVLLDLASTAEVRAAWADLTTRFAAVAADGILVQRQVKGSVELLLGARRDEQFGPVVVVGAGGVYVHVLDDVQLALAPVSPEGAERLLSRLRIWPLPRGVRGQPGADVGGLADTVSRFSQLASALGERLVELEINPLLIEASSGRPVAVDARGRLAAPPTSPNHPAVSREGQPS